VVSYLVIKRGAELLDKSAFMFGIIQDVMDEPSQFLRGFPQKPELMQRIELSECCAVLT
jgi:hypothetical protein